MTGNKIFPAPVPRTTVGELEFINKRGPNVKSKNSLPNSLEFLYEGGKHRHVQRRELGRQGPHPPKMLTHILLFALSALLLWFGAVWVVDSAAAIARKFNISELIIGLTVVAMGTSAPEFMVTATAALKGLPDISLSNIIGSNIFNLGIILGILAVIRPLETNKTMLWRDGALLFCVTALISVLALSHTLGRVDGVLLLLVLVGYMLLLWRQRQKTCRTVQPLGKAPAGRKASFRDWPKLLGGFVGVAAGGSLMVEAASGLAAALGVSQWIIGMTIVAAGTSLPEFVTCLAASARGKDHMLLGNLIGSDVYNFAGVLGTTCVLRPLDVSPDAVPSLFFLTSFVFLVLVFIRTGRRLSRLEGFLLIALGVGRWLWYAA